MALFQSRHGSAIKLSPGEMSVIDDRILCDYRSRFFSRNAEKSSQPKFSARDLLAISEEISREYAVQKLQQQISPQRQSEIVLLPVDPGHLHAYWHVDEKQQPRDNRPPLTLRIHSVSEQPANDERLPRCFDFVIEPGLTQHKVAVPEIMTDNYYRAELGWVHHDAHFTVLACSDMAFIPRAGSIRSQIPAKHLKIQTASALGKYAS